MILRNFHFTERDLLNTDCWETSISTWVIDFDGVILEIFLEIFEDHKSVSISILLHAKQFLLQWAITLNRLVVFKVPQFATLLLSFIYSAFFVYAVFYVASLPFWVDITISVWWQLLILKDFAMIKDGELFGTKSIIYCLVGMEWNWRKMKHFCQIWKDF